MISAKKSILWAFLIAVLSASIIFYQFNKIPSQLTGDEVEFARLAVQLGEQPYTPYSQYATGHATPYFYLLLASFKLFGLNEMALRLPSAVFGVLASVAMYYVLSLIFTHGCLEIRIPGMKKRFEIDTAFFLTLIFITMRWFFGFARFSFEATALLFLELVSLYAILSFIKQPKKLFWLIISAIFAGLAFNSYQPGRFFVVVPIAVLLLHKEARTLRTFFIFGGLFVMLITPLTMYLIQYPDIRVKQQLYFQDPNLTLVEKMQFFGDNVWRNTKLFFIEGDASGRHNYPFKAALNPILSVLGVVGLGYAVRMITKPINLLFLLYFGIAMGPTLLTYPHENPNMLRTVTVLPSLIYFVGMGIAWVHLQVRHYDKKNHFGSYFGTFLIVLLIAASTLELRTYFVHQRAIMKEAFEVTDRFGGVYYYMKQNKIDINKFRIPEDQINKFNSVPGPDPQQVYRNQ